ncbi:MAG: ECF-type sigma factor [Acidobacteriota bacterium]|nr:ECF-type sigma factor [Acidobacteriota bacterium]
MRKEDTSRKALNISRLLRDHYPELKKIAASVYQGIPAFLGLCEEDLVHDLFIELHKRKKTPFKGEGGFLTWARIHMKQQVIDAWRDFYRQKNGGGQHPRGLDDQPLYQH